jgi:RNA polymerase sigma factor (TIGR02999 family)
MDQLSSINTLDITNDASQFVAVVYDELKRIARCFMRRERVEHTLQPTALLHEALLRIGGDSTDLSSDPRSYCAAAASAMRRVLIDHARRRNAAKRGSDYVQLDLDHCRLPVEDMPIVDLLDLESALHRLAELNPRHAEVVQLRFFAGMSVQETASLLDISPTTVKSDWRLARAWLLAQLDMG